VAEATLREIEQRLKSVRNIEKITNSMKVIASTKLNKATRAMLAAKQFSIGNDELMKTLDLSYEGKKVLYIAVSSDSGLCGGIHSSIAKASKVELRKNPEADFICLGDKPKAQISRFSPTSMKLSFSAMAKDVPTFAAASTITDEILKEGLEYDVITIIYNKYISAISYESTTKNVVSESGLLGSSGFTHYESFTANPSPVTNEAAEAAEEDQGTQLAQFNLASAIFSALVEGHAAEISAKRQAMENASKNAKEMIGKLQMKYNRGRQAVITNELIDIITGASAL